MVENDFLESMQLLRELDRRPVHDFRSGETRMTEFKIPDIPITSALDKENRQKTKTDTFLNLRTTKEQPTQGPLDRIANLVQDLIYGQMIELCDAVCKGHPENSPVTQEKLPLLLHRWAMSHIAAFPHDAEKCK